MITKIEAAKIATNAGCHMIICDGRLENPLLQFARNTMLNSAGFRATDKANECS